MIEIQGVYTRYDKESIGEAIADWKYHHKKGKIIVEKDEENEFVATVNYKNGDREGVVIQKKEKKNETSK